jgi:hypothetical protein
VIEFVLKVIVEEAKYGAEWRAPKAGGKAKLELKGVVTP